MSSTVKPKPDPTAAARMKRARGKGKYVALTLTDQAAIDALETLSARQGSLRAALEWALIKATKYQGDY